jgi:hypothetical protein
VILAKTGISTVPDSAITGDIAVSPIVAAAMTGFSLILHQSEQYSTSEQVTGKCFAANYVSPTPSELTTAVSDMETAYTDAASRATTVSNFKAGNFNDNTLTLTPGVYTFETDINIVKDITFEGDENDVFIMQSTGSVKIASAVKILLRNGAQARNIFWQVAGEVVAETTSHMEGIILVKTAAKFNTGSSLNGRVLAQTACTLQMATITMPAEDTASSGAANIGPIIGGAAAGALALVSVAGVGVYMYKKKQTGEGADSSEGNTQAPTSSQPTPVA